MAKRGRPVIQVNVTDDQLAELNSQMQALNSTQPGWPLTFGKPETRTHNDKRRARIHLFLR